MNVEKMTKAEILLCWRKVNEELIYQKELVADMSSEISQLNKQLEFKIEELRRVKLNKEKEVKEEEEKKSRIIKKGTKIPPDKQTYITKCQVCGCKFTYMEKDIHYKEKTNSAYVICPECYYYKYPFINRKYKGDKRC